MDDLNPRVTYVRDPSLVPPLTPVFVVNGSIVVNINPGDIDIGGVEIKDSETANRAKVRAASTAPNPAENVLLVQALDPNGEVILRDDIQNIDAGVDVLISGQAQTQATITAILNNQGTLATAANQSSNNAVLAAIAAQGTHASPIYTLFNAATTPGASANVDVANYMHHTIQHTISGSVVVQTRSSLDGVNWFVEDETNQSGVVDLSGKTKFVSANIVYISGSVTTVLMSGN